MDLFFLSKYLYISTSVCFLCLTLSVKLTALKQLLTDLTSMVQLEVQEALPFSSLSLVTLSSSLCLSCLTLSFPFSLCLLYVSVFLFLSLSLSVPLYPSRLSLSLSIYLSLTLSV